MVSPSPTPYPGSAMSRRDHTCLWCHQAGAHDGHYHLPGPSRIRPADALRQLDIDQAIHVAIADEPRPPLGPHAEPLRHLRRLVWSIVGDSSSTRNNRESDLQPVLDLATDFPNLCGGIMDDFFHPTPVDGRLARWSPDAVAEFRRALHADGPRPLDLWVVVYDLLQGLPIQPWLDHCDVLTYWTWKAQDLPGLDRAIGWLRDIAPTQKLLLGCYMWDYGAGKPMPLETMRWQCAQAEQRLASGQIDGVIFLASNLCDLHIDTVAYARDWLHG